MKTAFRFALIFSLAAGLFAFPFNVLADNTLLDDPPPGGFSLLDGAPAAPAGNEQLIVDVSSNTYYKTLTGLDFHPLDSDMTYSSTNGGLYPLALVPGFGFTAAFNLPGDATVTGVSFFVVDNSDTTEIDLGALRYSPATSESWFLGSATTAGISPNIQSINLSGSIPFTILNSTHAYRLRVEFHSAGGSQILYGARITYTLPASPTYGTEYVTIAGADFRSSSSNMTFAALGGSLYATAIDPSFGFLTRLDLPEGATINEIQWFLIDNETENFNLRLYSHAPASDTFAIEVSSTSSGASAAIQAITRVVSITIDNQNKSFYIGLTPAAASVNLRIMGARVRYSRPSNLEVNAAQVKTFSGVHFYPSGSSLTYRAFGAKLNALALSSGRSFQASLDLPSGIRIDKITFYFKDESAQDFSFAGRYYYPSTGGYSDPVSGSSTGTDAAIRLITFSDLGPVMGVLDTYAMVSRLRVVHGAAGAEQYLIGAKVEYFYPKVYLPLTMNE